jgi:hypothetical protein
MTWVRFGPYEPAAPSLADALDLRGRASQVVFFEHGPDCTDCSRLVGQLAAAEDRWAELGARVVLVSPARRPDSDLVGGHLLADPNRQLRARYARLLEFDTADCLFLFVLDRHGAPVAAWVGQEVPATDLASEVADWLAFAERQCPE